MAHSTYLKQQHTEHNAQYRYMHLSTYESASYMNIFARVIRSSYKLEKKKK